MNVSRNAALLLCLMLCAASSFAQTESQIKRAAQGKTAVSQDEVVSFKSDVQYSQALKSLNELWKKFTGKIVIYRTGTKVTDKPIGMDIRGMYWKDAFELLLKQGKCWYNVYEEHIEILTQEDLLRAAQMDQKSVEQAKAPVTSGTEQAAPIQQFAQQMTQPAVVDSGEIFFRQREVTISAIFFELDRTAMASSGISFSVFRGKGLNLGIELTGASKVGTEGFNATLAPTDKRLAVDINAAIRVFESEQLGEVISRPQMTVKSGATARLVSGVSFSVNQRDFQGNTIQQFVETGTILNVTPRVYKVGETEFITLIYSVQKSSANPGQLTSIITKTEANGILQLLDGEEAYVGGLYSNEETVTREGVPVLKDLPWWVLGLRYLFGYDARQVSKKELIVLMKAELVPVLEERATYKGPARNVLQQKADEIQKDILKRQKSGNMPNR